MLGVVGPDAHPVGGDVEQMLGPAGAVGGAACGLALALDQRDPVAPSRSRCSACSVPDAPAPTTANRRAVTVTAGRLDLDRIGEGETVEDARRLVADQQHGAVQPALCPG